MKNFKYLSVIVMVACLFCVTCMYAVGGGDAILYR